MDGFRSNSNSNQNNSNQPYGSRGPDGTGGRGQQQQVDSSSHQNWMHSLGGVNGVSDALNGNVTMSMNSSSDQRIQNRNFPTSQPMTTGGSQISRPQREEQDSNLSSYFPPPSPAELHSTLSNSGTYASAHPLAHRSNSSSQNFNLNGGGGSNDSFLQDEPSSYMSRSLSHGVGMENRMNGGLDELSSGMGGTQMSASSSGPGAFGNSNQPYPDWSSLSLNSFGNGGGGGMMNTINENPQNQNGREANFQRRSLDSTNFNHSNQLVRSQSQSNHSSPTNPISHKRGPGSSYGPAAQSPSNTNSTIANRRNNSLNAAAAITPPRNKTILNRISRPEALPSSTATDSNQMVESPEDARDDRYRRSASGSGSGSGIGPGSADPADADASGNATASGPNSRSDSLGEENPEGMDEVEALEAEGNDETTPNLQTFDVSGFDVDVPSSMIRPSEPSFSMGRGQDMSELRRKQERGFEAPDGLHVGNARRTSQSKLGSNYNQSQNSSSSTSMMAPQAQPQRRQFLAQVSSSQASSSEDPSNSSTVPAGTSNLASSSRMNSNTPNAAPGVKRQTSGNRGRRKTNEANTFVASDSTAGSHPSDNEAVVPFTSTSAFLGPGKPNPNNAASSSSGANPDSAPHSNPTYDKPTINSTANHKIANAPYQAAASDFTRRKGWPVRVVEEIVDFVHVIDVRDDSPGLGDGVEWQQKVENGIALTRERRENQQKERRRSSAFETQGQGDDQDMEDDEQIEMTSHTIDSPLAFHFVGPRITPLTGWSPEELRGKGIWEFIHPDDIQAVISNFSRVRNSASEDMTVFYRFRRKPSTAKIEGDSDARSAGETTTSGDGDFGSLHFEDGRKIALAQNDLSSMATNLSSSNGDANPARRGSGKGAARVRNENDPEKEYVLFEATGHAFFGGGPSIPAGLLQQVDSSDPNYKMASQDHPLRSKDLQAALASTINPLYQGSRSSSTASVEAAAGTSRARSKTVGSATSVLALFCSARVYPPETVSMLDSFLELKVENEKLKSLIDKVQNDLSIADEEEKIRAAEHQKDRKSKESSSSRKAKFQRTHESNAPSADDIVSNLDHALEQNHQQQLGYGHQNLPGASSRESSGFGSSVPMNSQLSTSNSIASSFPATSEASISTQFLDGTANVSNWFNGNDISSFSALDPNFNQTSIRPGQLGIRSQTHAFHPTAHSSIFSRAQPSREQQQQQQQQQQQAQSQSHQFQPPHSPTKHGPHPYSRPTQNPRTMSLGGESNIGSDPSSSIQGYGNQSQSSQPQMIQNYLANSKAQTSTDHSHSSTVPGRSHPGSPDGSNSNQNSLERQQHQAMIDHARRISASSIPNLGADRIPVVPSNAPSASIRDENEQVGDVSNSTAVPAEEKQNEKKEKKKKSRKAKLETDYVCTDCGRVDSPEWRKGPQGPKTLCNACGLRYAKLMKKENGEEDGITAAAKEEKKKLKEAKKEAKKELKKEEKKEAKKSGKISRKSSKASIKSENQTSPNSNLFPFPDQQQQQQGQQQQDPNPNQNQNPHFNDPRSISHLYPLNQHHQQQMQQQAGFSGNDHHLSSMDVFGGLGMDIGLPNMNVMDMDLQDLQMNPNMDVDGMQHQQHQFSNPFGNQQDMRGDGNGNHRPVWDMN